MIRNQLIFSFICGVALAALLSPNADAQFELIKIDDQVLSVDSVSVEDEKVVLGSDQIDVNQFRLIDFKRPIRNVDSQAVVSLFGGGKLGATELTLADEVFTIKNVAGEIKLGVDAVTQIRFKKENLPLFNSTKPKEDLDQLFVKIKGTYQTVPGIVESVSESTVRIFYEEDIIEFKTEDVYGLMLAQDAERAAAEINGVVLLTEGSRIHCLVKSVTDGKVSAVIGGIADIEFPLDVVSKIEVHSDRLQFLSDIQPASVNNLDGAVFSRKLQKDRNITGGKLVLRNREKKVSRTYAKGLGTKSGMKLTFPTNGFDRFISTVGIDASTNGNGLCQIKVVSDGETLFEADLTGVDSPSQVDLDISGKDEIELIIEFGKDFLDLSDHVNWCDARFIKNSN